MTTKRPLSNILSGVIGGLIVLVVGAVLISTDVIDTGDTQTVVPQTPLTQPASGQPIVSAVVTAAEAFGPDHHPDVPDLIVRFRQDLGLIESCESPAVGYVRVYISDPDMRNPRLWRIGYTKFEMRRAGDTWQIAERLSRSVGAEDGAELLRHGL